MGLDMRFYKRIYLNPKNNSENGLEYPSIRVQEYTDFDGNKRDARIIDGATFVVVKIGDMRKANAIHGYLIDNCYEGDEPNCQWIVVSPQVIKDLRFICEDLLKNKKRKNFKELAESKLPACHGFFFGSYEYDEYYIECLEEFLDMTKDLPLDDDCVDYIYSPWY